METLANKIPFAVANDYAKYSFSLHPELTADRAYISSLLGRCGIYHRGDSKFSRRKRENSVAIEGCNVFSLFRETNYNIVDFFRRCQELIKGKKKGIFHLPLNLNYHTCEIHALKFFLAKTWTDTDACDALIDFIIKDQLSREEDLDARLFFYMTSKNFVPNKLSWTKIAVNDDEAMLYNDLHLYPIEKIVGDLGNCECTDKTCTVAFFKMSKSIPAEEFERNEELKEICSDMVRLLDF